MHIHDTWEIIDDYLNYNLEIQSLQSTTLKVQSTLWYAYIVPK